MHSCVKAAPQETANLAVHCVPVQAEAPCLGPRCPAGARVLWGTR